MISKEPVSEGVWDRSLLCPPALCGRYALIRWVVFSAGLAIHPDNRRWLALLSPAVWSLSPL